MLKIKLLLFLSVILVSCKTTRPITNAKKDQFTQDLNTLKNFFHIPGLSVLVKQGDHVLYESYIGYANLDQHTPMDSATTIPMASLTKVFSSILLMQLAEEKRLNLDDPIGKYVNDPKIGDSVKVKHVLSHTSQGTVGEHFYYSSRYSWLTQVIEKASGKSFKELLNERILQPLRLANTYLLGDAMQLVKEKRTIASPYLYGGSTKLGFIDYGYSSAAGVVSTVRDLAKLSDALDKNRLLTSADKEAMFHPFKKDLPYGYGIFTQEFLSHKLVWGYGQYECYSSLFLKVPDQDLTYIIAANNNLMSDPPRLIYGDVTNSLFALSFIKNFILDASDVPILQDAASLKSLQKKLTPANSEYYRKKLLAQALAQSFIAMYHPERADDSRRILRAVFKLYPDFRDYGDLALLHNLSMLRFLATSKDVGAAEFDLAIEAIGTKLLQNDPSNPYANNYMGSYYSLKGDTVSASQYYKSITTAPNFAKNWYTALAEKWLKDHNQ
jgi:CubicO group peptidase (beta-lactamase class C family)